ncbi:sugar ABC transporter ATP-binding protein [Pseudothermotoga elfii]|jgi:ABC-type sugar transport system ATPase subunit
MQDTLLSVEGVTKKFPGVRALNNVSLRCHKGTIHGLVGENGAGKSTLIKILSGIYKPDAGKIIFDGREVLFTSSREAILNGIRTVHQEFSLVPFLSIAENIFIEDSQTGKFFISRNKMISQATKLAEMLNFNRPVNTLVVDLSVGEQQLVEIMRALAHDAKLLILDEPTASLVPDEVEKLFEIMRKLRNDGTTIIFVSHRLPEILEICDVVTVLKDGEVVGNYETSALDQEKLASLMVGREMKKMFPEHFDEEIKKELLRIDELSIKDLKDPVNLVLYKGEILGLYGLEGQGQREFMRALAGLENIVSGKITIDGKQMKIRNPTDAIRNGIIYVPPDRKIEGLAVNLSIYENIGMAVLIAIDDKIVSENKLQSACRKVIQSFSIKASGPSQKVVNLSGGTQQKVVLGKWFGADFSPSILLLDEPTRGIDVGTKAEIYSILRKLASSGIGVIVSSSDMMEMLGLCDRIITFHDRKITGECNWKDFSEEKIMSLVAGISIETQHNSSQGGIEYVS